MFYDDLTATQKHHMSVIFTVKDTESLKMSGEKALAESSRHAKNTSIFEALRASLNR